MSSLVRALVVAVACLSGYTALACSCALGGPDEGDLHVAVEVRSRGCRLGSASQGRVEVVEILQDPTGLLEVGDVLPARFKNGSDAECGVDYGSGDVVTVIVPSNDEITLNLCNTGR